jgi:hypothetical protein
MVDSADPTGHALELARSAIRATAWRRTALAAVAKPAAEVAGLLLVEVLGGPRGRAAALGLARSLAGWLAGRRLPASAGVEVTTRRVTVVQDADTSALVHRVETALVVRTLAGPAPGPPMMTNPGQQGTTAVTSAQLDSPVLPTATRRRPPGAPPRQRFGMVAGRDPSPPSTRGLDRSRPHQARHAPRLGRHGQRVSPAPSPGYRCTTGQVRVRVTPLMAWIRDTTS